MRDGSRPAVLYSSNQHAREWISLEVNRRLLHHFVDGWRANDKEIRELLKDTELWFVISANPDGYQYTFDHERLWRKNLRDNNGDGEITVGDGVDPNRNFDEHWGYDNEGSSPDPADETYRGPSAALGARDAGDAGPDRPDQAEVPVEPALVRRSGCCTRRAGRPARSTPTTRSTWRSAAPTPNPAIPGFNPGQSADTLYVTNGETTDYADTQRGHRRLHARARRGQRRAPGFVFPDDEALIQAEFEKTLDFHLGLAQVGGATRRTRTRRSASTSSRSTSTRTTSTRRTGSSRCSTSSSRVSYGDPQEVRVLAKRSLGDVTCDYQVNGGAAQTKSTSEWAGGERYGPGNGDLLPRDARHGDRDRSPATA